MVRRKVREYMQAGSREVWVLDQVHTTGGIRVLQGTDALESPLLPGFRATVAEFLIGLGRSPIMERKYWPLDPSISDD